LLLLQIDTVDGDLTRVLTHLHHMEKTMQSEHGAFTQRGMGLDGVCDALLEDWACKQEPKLKGLMDRTLASEKFLPVDEDRKYSASVLDLFAMLSQTT
jgi:hypothetical protein